MLNYHYFGHSCFSLSDGQTTLLLDPFFSGNPLATIRAEDMDCDYILVSHGHADHLGDAPAIAQRTGLDQHRTQVLVGLQRLPVHPLFADPANFLNAVVAGDDPVAGHKLLDRHFAPGRGDQRARRETGDGDAMGEVRMLMLRHGRSPASCGPARAGPRDEYPGSADR